MLMGLAAAAFGGELERGDAAWDRRAEGHLDGEPDPAVIEQAIGAYAAALEAEPSNLEARWKLLRALHFEGEFATGERSAKQRIFARGRNVAEDGVELLARQIDAGKPAHKLDPDALREGVETAGISEHDLAAFYFWSSVHWGAWSQVAGLLGAVRRGGAGRCHDYAVFALALEPEYEGGGAHRMVSALHARLPRVPLISGWVDRSQALPHAKRALAIAPDHPGNPFLIALTLLDLYPDRRSEARTLLDEVLQMDPRPGWLIEDLAVRRAAERRLERERESVQD